MYSWWCNQLETFFVLPALVRAIHWSLMGSSHKGQWLGALMFSLICAWTNGWANNRDAADLRCHHAHYDVTVMCNVTWMFKSFTSLKNYTWLHHVNHVNHKTVSCSSDTVAQLWSAIIPVWAFMWRYGGIYLCTALLLISPYQLKLFGKDKEIQ